MLANILRMLAMLILIQINYNQVFNAASASASTIAAAAAAIPNDRPTDTFYIRHGRSKVRHSNEKEQILRSLLAATKTNLTHDAAAGSMSYDNKLSSAVTAGRGSVPPRRLSSLMVSSSSSSIIPSGNGHLFGSEYWQNSDANGTMIVNHHIPVPASPIGKPHLLEATSSPTTSAVAGDLSYHRSKPIPPPTLTPDSITALVPVTHKIRKLHMKKIMERIRNRVDKRLGITKMSKNHRSLVEAEHMQGRPTDVNEDDDDDDDDDEDDLKMGGELSEVMQMADELDLEGININNNNDNSFANDAYQNDEEYVLATTPTATSATTTASITSKKQQHELTYDATFAPASDVDDDDGMNFQLNKIIEKTTERPEHAYAESIEERINVYNKLENNTPPPLPAKNYATSTFLRKLPIPKSTKLHMNKPTLLRLDELNETDYSFSKHFDSLNTAEDDDELESAAVNEALPPDTYEFDSAQDMSELVSMENISNSAATSTEDEQLAVGNAERYASIRLANIDSNAVVYSSEAPTLRTTDYINLSETHSLGPSQALASTSVGGIAMDRQKALDIEEINFDDVGLSENFEDGTMDDGHMIDNHNANGFPLSAADSNDEEPDPYETNRYLAGVVDAANQDEIYDWDEISRNNRRNLMRGRDVVTKFLQIVETQHSLGSNCEAGTSLNLGEGVVDRYAQDRFRVEAEVAVNRANMLTRIFKMTAAAVQADVNLLHASVLSMVEFDDDIFAAGNCFDWNEHPAQPGLFCPFAYRLPPPNLGAIFAKDLATEYHYLGNTSEWFFQARKNAEKVIARNEQYLKSFHLYSNKTDERIEYDTLAVKYEDGRWSKPYYDCGGGNIWMLTYTVPFFGYENGTYHFKGTSGIDIDLRRVDIDQCPQRNTPGTTQPLNIFAGTDKCKQRTTMCEALKGLGFRRGSYKCICRKGYYFPDTTITQKFFNGSLLEEEYEKLMLGKNSTYNIINEYECLPCAEGCDSCEDGSPCIAALNWPMRTSILVLACTVIGLLPPAAWFTFRYQQVKVVRAASPALLRVIALGAFFIYCTNIVMYPNPNLYTCTARIWMREIGFSLTYGALMLKTWRISVIFRVRSAKAVKITDAALLKRLGIICGVIGTCLLVRTLVSPPDVVVGRTADDLKAFLCKTDWWDYTFTSMEVLFLAWGVRLCIMVRKAPSEFNESRFISMAIYNEFLLTCFLNVSMLFLQSPANPDLLYIIFFCHTQLTVTLLLALIFGSKVYIVLRSGKSHQESIGLGAKSSGAKFNFRPQIRTFANPSSITTSTVPVAGTTSAETKLSDQEALEEIRQLSMQLQRIQEMAPPKGVAVMTISSLLDGLKTPGGMMLVAAAATHAATSSGNQLAVRYAVGGGGGGGAGALPLLSLNVNEMQKYNQQQLQVPQNNNINGGVSGKPAAIMAAAATTTMTTTTTVTEVATAPTSTEAALTVDNETTTSTTMTEIRITCEEKAVNTDVTGELSFEARQTTSSAQADAHIICSRCLEISKDHYYTCRPSSPPTSLPAQKTCQQLGSPQQEGSISFANIKLDCMCSQPDYLDDVRQQQQQQEQHQRSRRRVNMRSAATNTPPSTVSSRRRSKTKSGADVSVSYQICDNCKNKYHSKRSSNKKSYKNNSKGSNKSALKLVAAAKSLCAGASGSSGGGGISQTRSNDLLDRMLPATTSSTSTTTLVASHHRKKMHSIDDITFYTTTDDDDESSTGDDDDNSGAESDTSVKRRLQLLPAQTEFKCQSSIALSSIITTTIISETETIASTLDDSGGHAGDASTSGAAGTTDSIAVAAHSSHDNISNNSNNSTSQHSNNDNSNNSTNKTNDANRPKRPDKLLLDLNDRSKYTKEVSV